MRGSRRHFSGKTAQKGRILTPEMATSTATAGILDFKMATTAVEAGILDFKMATATVEADILIFKMASHAGGILSGSISKNVINILK